MKKRTDFVSNSSSSSFVVLADKDTPGIFKDELLTFAEFRDNNFFERDVVECLDLNLKFFSRYESVDYIFGKIRFMTPGEFAAEYTAFGGETRNFSETYPVLTSDRGLVDELRELAGEYKGLDRLRSKIYRRGEIDVELQRRADDAICALRDRCGVKIDIILDKMSSHFLAAVEGKMSGWKFWYAELDDNREPDGRRAMDGVRWGRVFSNH